MDLAEHYFEEFGDEARADCVSIAMRICWQISHGVGLSESYYLVLDNDVLNALQKPNEYRERYVALIFVALYLSKSNLRFRIAITPAILYEFCGNDAFQSEEKFNNALMFLYRTLARLNAPIHLFGINSYKEAKHYHKSILHDIKLIRNTIESVRSTEWNVDLRTEHGIKFPHVVARELTPRVRTKYFSRFHAEHILQSLIESKIIHNKRTDRYARKHMRNEIAMRKAKLLETDGYKLKGVGDLSILSVCDIGSQFFHKTEYTIIAVTFDKRLEEIMRKHSSLHIASDEFIGGRESEETIQEKLNAFFKAEQELNEITSKAEVFMSSFIEFLEAKIMKTNTS